MNRIYEFAKAKADSMNVRCTTLFLMINTVIWAFIGAIIGSILCVEIHSTVQLMLMQMVICIGYAGFGIGFLGGSLYLLCKR